MAAAELPAGRGRILEGLALGRKRSDLRCTGCPIWPILPMRILTFRTSKNPPPDCVIEALDHGIADAAGEGEVAERGRGFIGVETSDGGEGVIIQQAGNVAMLRRGSE